MAQFDLFENRSPASKHEFPWLLELSSNLFEDANRAIYVPLVKATSLGKPDETLNPRIPTAVGDVRLVPLDIASAPRDAVGKRIGNVKEHGDRILAALDLVFARF